MAELEPEMIESDAGEPKQPVRRSRLRIFLLGLGLTAGTILFIALLLFVVYRSGTFDTYVRGQITTRLSEMGIAFDAEAFRISATPLKLHIRNATFNNKTTGEKIFFIREGYLSLSIIDVFSMQLSRDIRIDKTEIAGAEIWINFDENGWSNFSDLKLIEDEDGTAVNFRYESVNFSLTESVVHFGDLSRQISADARNITFLLSPSEESLIDGPTLFAFDLTSTESQFNYDGESITNIDLRATGNANDTGMDLRSFELRTPVGEASLTGRMSDWASPKYEFDIRSTLDLTQIAGFVQSGTNLTGMANFTGKIRGEGESYTIEGEADSAAIRAEGLNLRGTSVVATVSGTNSSYEANGTAIAEMLTFDDFRVDLLKMIGNVRGTGTDFRWWGELQAAAASTPNLTIGGLYLSEALAEYKDRQMRIEAGFGRTRTFEVGDINISDLSARGLKFSQPNGGIRLTAPTANARSLASPDFSLSELAGRDLIVANDRGRTSVQIAALRSGSATVAGSLVRNVSADLFDLVNLPSSTVLKASNLRAERVDFEGTRVDQLNTPLVELTTSSGKTVIYSDNVRVASINTGTALLGSMNIGGVRLSIARGRVEARSNDIDAGDVILAKNEDLPDGGRLDGVSIARPVFILEPSGRYRATADMTLGGGAIGSVGIGAARTSVEVTNEQFMLAGIEANAMDGTVTGDAVIARRSTGESAITGSFSEVGVSKLLALFGGHAMPVKGGTTGNIDITFRGTDIRTASGAVNADISASAGSDESSFIPLSGEVRLRGDNGLFNIDAANLKTAESTFSASGQFDLKDEDSKLNIALNSNDASEVDRLVRVLGISPELENQLDSLNVQLAGVMRFDGSIEGNISRPVVEGGGEIASVLVRGRNLGRISTDLSVTTDAVDFKNGRLEEPGGGSATFAVSIPLSGINNITVDATLNNIDAGNLLAALPIELPARIADLDGKTSGTVDIRGLPNEAQGSVDLRAAGGTISGQAFDRLDIRAIFAGTRINLEKAEITVGDGRLNVDGGFDRASGLFDFKLTGDKIPLPIALALLPENASIPAITGVFSANATAKGVFENEETYDVEFNGSARDVLVGGSPFGNITFDGKTANGVLSANANGDMGGRPQVITGTLNLLDDGLPLNVVTQFDQSPIEPFLAFVPRLQGLDIKGIATGTINFGGNIASVDPNGNQIYTSTNLSGTALLSQLSLQIEDTQLAAAEPVSLRFSPREITFDSARFSGGGSNMAISGTYAFAADAVNSLAIEGRVNLDLLNLTTRDTFFSGFADTSVRYSGVGSNARLSGTANVVNGTVSAFLGSDRFSADRIKARVIFTSDQVAIEEASGYLGGGRFTAVGGGILDGLSLQALRFSLVGNNVTVPLPKDFITTGDARLEITMQREEGISGLATEIRGRVLARRSLYSKDIDLANVVGARRDPILSGGGNGALTPPRFDIIIEGRDALIVKNNIADLTASVSLVLTGDTNEPRISGRITANSGTIFFRKDRYIVQRGVLEFPPDTAIDPVINLQAESEISGYQIFVNLSGPLRDTELLTANVRSSPALPQADVVSLITTGSLANTTGGIPTLAQSGINTAAEILTDAIINDPARRATDRLFGLNVFEIDPIISGQQINPSARLTVGRQINNNLRVTYATNLSQDQNQVLAVEYRVSNRLSFVAQYEQRSLTNVTRNRDNFSFEIRFRKRF